MESYKQATMIDGKPAIQYFGEILDRFEKEEFCAEKARAEARHMREYNKQSRNTLRAMINGLYDK